MAQTRQQIEAFVRRLVVEVEAAEAAGMTAPQAIADRLNANGVTSRKGRRWTGAAVAKFLSSPGAKRTRSGGQSGSGGKSGPGGKAGRVAKRGPR